MGQLHELRLRSNQFIANINSNVERAIMLVDYRLLDLNRDQMRYNQIDATGAKITPVYSPGYKKEKGVSYNNPDLYVSGDFQNKLFMNVKGENYVIKSSDWKNAKLTEKYGAQLFGIAPMNQETAKQIVNGSLATIYKADVIR